MERTLIMIAIVVTIFSQSLWAQERAGCQPAKEFSKVAEVYVMNVGTTEAQQIQREMINIQSRACRGDYGRADAIVYGNGQRATASAGDTTGTWTWPNGTTITTNATDENASVNYPNGNLMTTGFRHIGSTFNYPDGKTMSANAGELGRDINDMAGGVQTVGSPDFTVAAKSGQLNVEKFLSYVNEINAAAAAPQQAPPVPSLLDLDRARMRANNQ